MFSYLMVSLNVFPSEVLALILNGKNSWAALELWKTGDRILQAKLKANGITHVDLHHVTMRTKYKVALVWPRCLKEFRLQSLSLKCRFTEHSASVIRGDLMRLYPGLEALTLDFAGSLTLFCEIDPSAPTSAPNVASQHEDAGERLSKRPKLGSDEAETKLSDMWNPTRAFPSLKSLALIDTGRHGTLAFPSLPSLTDLTFKSNTVLDCSALVALEKLTIFESSLYVKHVETLKTCPKSLTSIDSDSPPLVEFWISDAEALFPNLKSIHAQHRPHRHSQTLAKAASNVLLRSAPAVDPNWTGPEVAEIEKETPFSIFSSLLPQWTNLITLKVLSNNMTAAHFHVLPRQLKHLQFGGKTAPNFHSALPHGVASINGPDSALWAKRKDELLNYGTTRNGSDAKWVKSYIDRVENGHLYGLPLGLTSLLIENDTPGDWVTDNELVLPPSIRQFGGAVKFNEASGFFEILPPFIDNLVLRETKAHTFTPDAPIHYPSLAASYARFATLPFLRSVKFSYLYDQQASELMAILPRSVISLILDIQGRKFDVSSLSTLPAQLQSLTLLGQTFPSQLAWLSLLPRGLTYFKTYMLMNSPDLVHLPPTLTELVGFVRNFTAKDVLSLPRSLSIIDLYAEKRYEPGDKPDKGILTSPGWRQLVDVHRPFWRVFSKTGSEIETEIKSFKP